MQNEVGTRAYEQTIAGDRLATVKGYALTGDDRLRAEIIERIMCDFGVDLDPICARHGLSASTMLKSSSRLQDLISDGIVELDGTSLAVADDFRAFWSAAWRRRSTPTSMDRSSCTAGRFDVTARRGDQLQEVFDLRRRSFNAASETFRSSDA